MLNNVDANMKISTIGISTINASTIGEGIITLEAAWDNIKTQYDLWRTTKPTLQTIGIKNIAFFLHSNSPFQEHSYSTFHIFKSDAENLNSEIYLSQQGQKDIYADLSSLSSSTSARCLDLKPVSIKNLITSHPPFKLFEQGANTYVVPYRGSRSLNGYTIFDTDNKWGITLNESVSVLRILFNLFYDKLSSLYFNTHNETPHISSREKQVLQLLVSGKTNSEIAKGLGISAHTIMSYVNILSMKLHTSNRTATAVKAVSLGMVRI